MGVLWTKADIEYLKEHYPDSTAKEIAQSLRRTERSIYTKARDLKIKKSEAFLNSEKSGRLNGSQGVETRYKKGNIPSNKGKNQPSHANTIKTQFKKGNKPHNYQPVGSTRINIYGYMEVKVSDPRKWEFVHRLEYEKYYGPIPEEYVVILKDGDKLNITKDNLQAIPREEAIKITHKSKGYAAYLLERDPHKRAVLLEEYPDIIHIKQLQLELNETISNHE
jgi:hypothetical protein